MTLQPMPRYGAGSLGISDLSRQFLGGANALLGYMEMEEVTDLLINGLEAVYLERAGYLERVGSPFADGQALYDFIERLLVPMGKRVDASQPYSDGRLLDGSRFHIILPPIAPEGPLISIRKKRSPEQVTLDSFGPPEVVSALVACVLGRRNVLICGGTGAGKTTLLSRLVDHVPHSERIVVIEECLEIVGNHPHILHLEARPPSPDGLGEVSLRTLIKNALRMRPDRLILGECRGPEAFDLIQVMNSGHRGSFCTVHANSARDALRRIEGMVLMAGLDVSLAVVRDWIAGAVDAVVHLDRRGLKRQIFEIMDINGMEGEVYRIYPRWALGEEGPSGLK